MEPAESQDDPEVEQGCVLVVEDDPLQRRVVVRLLRLWGYQTEEAADGASALSQVQAEASRFRAIVLDIMLPILDGVSVAGEVRSAWPALPIVACSAGLNEFVEARLREIGVEECLSKPYSADALRGALKRSIERI
jgi:CheY-like chemotaxis protein